MLRDFPAARRSAGIAMAVAIAVGAAPLAACGIRGPLKLPPASAPAASTPTATPAEPGAAREPQQPDRKP